MTFFPLQAVLPLLLSAALLLTGCYDRWTGNYAEVPELSGDEGAFLESAELSQEERQKQLEELRKLAGETPPAYTINSGDKFEIVVYNHPDLSVKTAVTPDGHIGMVLVGQIKVSGLTIGAAAAKIEESLSRYIRNPKVGLSPYEIVSQTATISGAVTYSGKYPIDDGMRLADLFAKAGGAASHYYDGQTMRAADLEHSFFIREHKILPVNFVAAIERGDPLHNIVLRRGDYIYIAARDSSMVYLLGEVKRPGRQVWTSRLGLLELLASCGWLNEPYWHHAIIIRGGLARAQMHKVDLDGILRGTVPNPPLRPGDIVYVPRDNISEYNVLVRKLMPTAQLINMLLTPAAFATSRL